VSEEPDEHTERLAAAIAALDDDALRSAVGAMAEPTRTELAGTLQLPRATMHLGNALPPLLRRKLLASPAPRQLNAAFALAEAVNDDTVRALGPRHDDPSREDMLDVLPAIVDEHGAPLVTLMLAAYAASDAQCQAVFAELLVTDERFAIGEPVASDEGDAGGTPAAGGSVSASDTTTEPERDLRREERKASKSARRNARQHERAAQQAAHAARKAAQRRAKRGS
jgi:hypothetical protein